MANHKVVDADKLDADLASVADTIREKTAGGATLTFPDGFVAAISSIEQGGEDVVLQSKSVTPTEAIQEVTADEGYTALEKVTVEAIPSEYIVPSGDLAITENGTFDVTQYASAEVNVPSEEPILEEITITENGEYTPSGDGYSKVTVEVEVARPQLFAPTISLDGDTLTITANADNGAFAASYDLYVDALLVGNYTSTTIDLTTLGLAEGTYSITARAKGANFVDSADSVAVSYEVVPTYVNLLTSDGYYLVASDGTILMAKE